MSCLISSERRARLGCLEGRVWHVLNHHKTATAYLQPSEAGVDLWMETVQTDGAFCPSDNLAIIVLPGRGYLQFCYCINKLLRKTWVFLK